MTGSVLAIATFALTVGTGEPEGARPAHEPAAVALVRAAAIADTSLRSLNWTQDLIITDPIEGEMALASASQGCDDRGRWYWIGQWCGRVLDDGPFVHTRSSYVSADPLVVYAWDPDAGSGIVRPPDRFERQMYAAVDCLLFRRLDPLNHRTLAELLLDGESLVIREWSADGDPVLEGVTNIAGYMARVDVTLDASKSFLPSKFWMKDVLSSASVADHKVTRWELVAGHWVPTGGELRSFQNGSTEEQLEKFVASLNRVGLTERADPLNLKHRELYRAAVQEAYGEEGIPTKPLGVGAVEVRARDVNVNRGLSPAHMTLPSGVSFFDAFHQRPVAGSVARQLQPSQRFVTQEPPSGHERPESVRGSVWIEERGSTDFGDCLVGDSLTADYTIHNSGSKPIAVSVQSKSCGCIEAELEADSIGPRESKRLTLRARVGPGGAVQRHGATILATDGVNRWPLMASLTYMVRSTVVVVPERAVAYTTLGEEAVVKIAVQEQAGGELDPPAVQVDGPARVEIGEQERVQIGAVRLVTVTFPPAVTARSVHIVRIRTASDTAEIIVPVHVRAGSAVHVEPVGLTWTNASGDRLEEKHMIISGLKSEPVVRFAGESQGAALPETRLDRVSENSWRLSVRPPVGSADPASAEVLIEEGPGGRRLGTALIAWNLAPPAAR